MTRQTLFLTNRGNQQKTEDHLCTIILIWEGISLFEYYRYIVFCLYSKTWYSFWRKCARNVALIKAAHLTPGLSVLLEALTQLLQFLLCALNCRLELGIPLSLLLDVAFEFLNPLQLALTAFGSSGAVPCAFAFQLLALLIVHVETEI